jgi:predicted nucleic acid-binding Zn finger protein
MQRLEFANKKSNNSVVSKSEEIENSREVKGAALSQTRNVFYMSGAKDVYYVQSERSEDIYYYVKYNPDVIEYCSCPDNSIKLEKCKHIWSIEKSIVKGTLKEIDKLPVNAKQFANKIPVVQQSKSWRDSEYDF